MREADDKETSNELGFALGATLVGGVPIEDAIVRFVD